MAMLFRKGNNYGVTIVETTSYTETVVMDVPAAEHDGNCKCGSSCTCVNCTCGH
ncbi:Metallothionein, family 15, plant [Sesbania bispinosa]|nr:Metallothionein, family 15, plant [Sesbania bispinosa]